MIFELTIQLRWNLGSSDTNVIFAQNFRTCHDSIQNCGAKTYHFSQTKKLHIIRAYLAFWAYQSYSAIDPNTLYKYNRAMYMCIHTSTVIHPRACLAGNTQAGLKVSLQYNKLAILRSRFFSCDIFMLLSFYITSRRKFGNMSLFRVYAWELTTSYLAPSYPMPLCTRTVLLSARYHREIPSRFSNWVTFVNLFLRFFAIVLIHLLLKSYCP